MDLLLTLRHGAADFGRAAPTVPADAPLAEQVLGITEEAFAHAAGVLMAAEENDLPLRHQRSSTDLSLLVMEPRGLSIHHEVSALESLPLGTHP